MLRHSLSKCVTAGAFRTAATNFNMSSVLLPANSTMNTSPIIRNNYFQPHRPTIGACRYRSNRSRRGLYDGKDVRSGNNVSFSMRATKRKFKPNVFCKRVYSEVLDEMVRFHLTTSALRSIDKVGGLDNYLLSSKYVTSGEGKEIKERILAKLAFEERQKARELKAVTDSSMVE